MKKVEAESLGAVHTHTHTHHAFYQMQTLVKFAKACLLYSKI